MGRETQQPRNDTHARNSAKCSGRSLPPHSPHPGVAWPNRTQHSRHGSECLSTDARGRRRSGGGNQGWEQSGVSRAQCVLRQGRWPSAAEIDVLGGWRGGEWKRPVLPPAPCFQSRNPGWRLVRNTKQKGVNQMGDGEQRPFSGGETPAGRGAHSGRHGAFAGRPEARRRCFLVWGWSPSVAGRSSTGSERRVRPGGRGATRGGVIHRPAQPRRLHGDGYLTAETGRAAERVFAGCCATAQ